MRLRPHATSDRCRRAGLRGACCGECLRTSERSWASDAAHRHLRAEGNPRFGCADIWGCSALLLGQIRAKLGQSQLTLGRGVPILVKSWSLWVETGARRSEITPKMPPRDLSRMCPSSVPHPARRAAFWRVGFPHLFATPDARRCVFFRRGGGVFAGGTTQVRRSRRQNPRQGWPLLTTPFRRVFEPRL